MRWNCGYIWFQVFVYVSTAYSQTYDIILEEKHYPAIVKFQQMEKYINHVDGDILNALSHKYAHCWFLQVWVRNLINYFNCRILGKFPNTYGFTKCMAEDLVYQYREKFPTAIGRPAISKQLNWINKIITLLQLSYFFTILNIHRSVISCWNEPLPGYTEGLHGTNGWSLAVGRGVLRSMQCQHQYPCNVIPCDIVVNGLIILAYERSTIKYAHIWFNYSPSCPMLFLKKN